MSVKQLIARPLDPADRQAWDSLACRYGSIFDSPNWTDLLGPSLSRLGIYDAGGGLRGGFCLWGQRRFGLRMLSNPPDTPQAGPFYEPKASNPAARTDEQRAVVEAMADYLSSADAAVVSLYLSRGITDCLPFYWRGWKVVPHYTYLIDLAQDDDTLLAAMSTERRKNVRKSRTDGVTVEETADMSAMRALVMETFDRQNMSISLAEIDRIFSGFPPGESSYCFISLMDGRPVAGIYVVHDARTAYYLLGGYAENAHHGAGALAMWHAILKAKQLGLKVFDFEGSIIPPIERYFRGFGGVLTPMFSVHRAWLPIEMALKVNARYRNRF
jgi:hypothetical protein